MHPPSLQHVWMVGLAEPDVLDNASALVSSVSNTMGGMPGLLPEREGAELRKMMVVILCMDF